MTNSSKKKFDIIVLGSGIAGISIASELSEYLNVCVLEKEGLISYHSTGRSLAFYLESYGNEVIRQLTSASKDFFYNRIDTTSKNILIKKRGVIHIANKFQTIKLKNLYKTLTKNNENFKILNKLQTMELLPCLNDEYVDSSIYDSEASDIDVNAVYNIYLKNLTKNNGKVITDIKITEFLHQVHGWKILTNQDEFYTKIIVNAAGAWCDLIATNVGAKKINIVPKKRTIFCFKPTNIKLNNKWPLGVDVEENFYFKIENDTVIASPADETPTVPHDVQAEDIDIALGIERIKNSTLFEFNSIFNKWAGLRSFVKDKNPVIGFDNKFKNFFWFAGQGGYGIQTAPALSKIASNLILKKSNNYYENEFQINLNLLKINRFYK
jgi:D-arginine dehydrogenase